VDPGYENPFIKNVSIDKSKVKYHSVIQAPELPVIGATLVCPCQYVTVMYKLDQNLPKRRLILGPLEGLGFRVQVILGNIEFGYSCSPRANTLP